MWSTVTHSHPVFLEVKIRETQLRRKKEAWWKDLGERGMFDSCEENHIYSSKEQKETDTDRIPHNFTRVLQKVCGKEFKAAAAIAVWCNSLSHGLGLLDTRTKLMAQLLATLLQIQLSAPMYLRGSRWQIHGRVLATRLPDPEGRHLASPRSIPHSGRCLVNNLAERKIFLLSLLNRIIKN